MGVWAAPYNLRSLTVSDGLSDLVVNALYKDSTGYLWIGTGNALERFDGVHLKHFPISGSDGNRKRVHAITSTSDGRIWMGNGMGLWRMDKRHTGLEQILPEQINNSVYSLLADRNGALYIGSERGLFIYREGNIEQILLESNAFSAANVIYAIASDEEGCLWLATGGGLFSLSLSDNKVDAYHNVTGDKHICAFRTLARIGSQLYLGTMDQGIVAFDTRKKIFSPYVSVGCNVISSLSTDGKRLLYVGTDGNGVHFIDTHSGSIVHTMRHKAGEESLRSNSVYSLLVDRDGLIWVGYYQAGLDYTLYQRNLFTTYAWQPRFDSKDMPVRALAIQGSEKLIGTRDGFFFIDEQRGRFKSFLPGQLRSGMVFTILYHQGEYYVGTYGGGIYIFNSQTLTLRDFAPKEETVFQRGHIFCIKEDAAGQLWIGTEEGIYCYKGNQQLAHYHSGNSKLPAGNVYEIYFDSTGKGWVCTENGLCLWDPSSRQLRTDLFPEGFLHKEKVRVVYEDTAHNLYFFPDKGPLFVSDLTMDSYRWVRPDTPMPGADGTFIIEDSEGWLWLGTGNGLFRYNKQDDFVPYSFVDGIPNPTFTLCLPVFDAQGNLWMGNNKGLLRLDMQHLRSMKGAAFRPVVTDVHIDGKSPAVSLMKETEKGMQVTLDAGQKNVTFHVSDFSYTSPIYLSYEYQLEGVDEEWKTLVSQSQVTYYDLPAGTRLFKLRRLGHPETETQLLVKVSASIPWWNVASMAGLVLLLCMALYYRFLWRSRKQKNMELSQAGIPLQVLPASENTDRIEGLAEKAKQAKEEAKSAKEEKYKGLHLTAEECQKLVKTLEAVMRKEKLYTNPDLKMADLVAKTGISSHILSYIFNQHLARNYYDYVNDYRIAEFKRLVEEDKLSKYTLSALAEQSGFSSRASFFRTFKKMTGVTPNEYIQNIGRHNE